MKKLFFISLLFVLLSQSSFSQREKKPLGTVINASATFNYYPTTHSFSFSTSYLTYDDDIILTFLTSSSGTFVIEEDDPLLINRENRSDFPSQLLGIGASIQIIEKNSLFHEISLTKLSFAKSSYLVDLSFRDSLNKLYQIRRGFKQNSSAVGIRYEIGTYFGKNRSAKFRFGLSGGIETSFYSYKRTPLALSASSGFPMRAKFFTLDFAIIPMASVKLSKRLALDFKIISNLLVGDFGSVKEENPSQTKRGQEGNRVNDLPEVSTAFSLLLRYNIKEPKKRRR